MSSFTILLLASGDAMAYRVLRCAAATGARIHVLGTSDEGRSRRLTWSRHCASYHSQDDGAFEPGDAAVGVINELVAQLGIDLVVPGDAITQRFLARHAARLKTARTFPSPDAATLERLRDKAQFAALCAELDVPHPATCLLPDGDTVRRGIESGTLRLPVMVKPTDLAGGLGVRQLHGERAAADAAALPYQPVLLQDFVPGHDVSISFFCDAGTVRASAMYRYVDETYVFFFDQALHDMASRVVTAVGYTGAVGFDARIGPTGEMWLIECNPRFTYHVDISMLAGVNLVALGQALAPGTGGEVRAAPQRIQHAKLLKPWTLWRGDRRHARYILDDSLRFTLWVAVRDFVRQKLTAPAWARIGRVAASTEPRAVS